VEKKNEAEHFTVGTYHLGLQKFWNWTKS
jgi:hypothetical protein